MSSPQYFGLLGVIFVAACCVAPTDKDVAATFCSYLAGFTFGLAILTKWVF